MPVLQIQDRFRTALRSHWALWTTWIATRIFQIRNSAQHQWSAGDIDYYGQGVAHFQRDTLGEYPAYGLLPAYIVRIVAGEGQESFRIGFYIAAGLVDALFLCLILYSGLMKQHGIHPLRAAWFWIFFGLAMGTLMYSRLDLFVGVVVALVFLLSFKNSTLASALLALATLMKLWPGVLLAGLSGSLKTNSKFWERLLAFALSMWVLAIGIIVFWGAERITSPLDYQGDRGLQIESVVATPLMWMAGNLGADGSSKYSIQYASSKSFEITGPGVSTAMFVSTIAVGAMVFFALAWALYLTRQQILNARVFTAWGILMVFLLIVTNKVFSPQYIIWLGPIMAVGIAVLPKSRSLWALALATLVASFLTFGVYPSHYPDIIGATNGHGKGMFYLVARNITMIIATVCAARVLWNTVLTTRTLTTTTKTASTETEPAA